MVGGTTPHAYARGLRERGGSEELLQVIREIDSACLSSGVASVYTLHHLAVISHSPHRVIRDAIFNNADYYKVHYIAKRSSGRRVIHSPVMRLKGIQRAILDACLPKGASSQISFAFEEGRSTVDAAREHIGARSMIHVDVQNFFGSIPSRSVFRVFADIGYPELLSMELALLSTAGHAVAARDEDAGGYPYRVARGGFLPQGASTSGKLSNLKCSRLDEKLIQISQRSGGSVTRYADDISLSLPGSIAAKEASGLLAELRRVVQSEGFRLNDKKTHIVKNGREFRVLGLVVGENSVWLNPCYKRNMRKHLYGLEKFGLSPHANSQGKNDLEMIEFIWGHYAYSVNADPKFGEEMKDRLIGAGIRRL